MEYQEGNLACKVLLVDDEENILHALERLLMEDDLEVLTATSGESGLDVLQGEPDVALVLSDQRMPGMSGAEFLQQARALAPDAVRMVLTGYADLNTTMDAINKGGASRYITKPWDDELLLQAIRDGVGHYRLLMENRRLTALVERQNAELQEWNTNLKGRVMEQTATIRRQNDELKSRNVKLQDAFRRTIQAFSRLIEQHSIRLQEHTANVTELAVNAARDLGLPPAEVETIRTAALLHDIGVMGIAPEVLEKRVSALDREELAIFLQHAVRGQAAVDEVEELREAGVLIRHHHEQYDGKGFPDRLSGADIPLGARLIAFADFVDCELEEQRGEAAVWTVLRKAAKALGKQLDPELFDVLEPHIKALYLPPRSQNAEEAEKELRPSQLLEGMRVTRNLYSGSGLLMLTKGAVLDSHKITKVRRCYSADAPAGGIFVSWCSNPAKAAGGEELQSGYERELRPSQLKEGMRISRNLYSGTGLLLLTEGTELDAGKIVSVVRYFQIDPPAGGVFVEVGGLSS